ncbi:MAG TPA: CPBP family intramembrane glutamic endopeptidase [Rhabdochlamydiaceae bacterium]|nr:CPBP family intramembrane glutamic endopeptidase [Rhabdochlamydiaceae bacterium]
MDISILFVALLAILLNWIAYRKDFYHFELNARPSVPISFFELITNFAIYLIFSLMLAPIFAKLYLKYLNFKDPSITSLSISTISSFQLITMGAILFGMMLFMDIHNPAILRRIWKDKLKTSRSSLYDFSRGIIAWFLAFPIVVVISQLCDYLINSLFGQQQYEQAAVHFVKTAMQQNGSLFMSMISVIIFAPIIEEFLFRGSLQNFLKVHFGTKAAIQISALSFSLFHLTPSQGIGNFSLAVSLFILGLFLGFLYEKQSSLFASIGLHMTFNTVSAMRIIFSTEAT